MAKSKKSSKLEDVKAKATRVFAHGAAMAAASAANLTKKKGALASILFVAMLLTWLCLDTLGGLTLALLYASPDGSVKSGRSGSVVYQRNGRRRLMNYFATVINGYTTPVKARLSFLSSGWNSLTDAERASWNSATSFSFVDRFAVPHILRGKDLYVSLNSNLINVGLTPLNNCPSPEVITGITSMTAVVDISLGSMTIGYAPTPTDIDTIHLVFATAALNAGVSKPKKSAYRQIGTIPAATATPYVATSDWETKFSNIAALTPGQKIGIKLVPVNTNTGQAGAAIGLVAAVVA